MNFFSQRDPKNGKNCRSPKSIFLKISKKNFQGDFLSQVLTTRIMIQGQNYERKIPDVLTI